MKFGKRGTFIPMIFIIFVAVTWIVQFPSKQIGYLLESDNKMWPKDSESTDNWIEHYEDFIQKATLRNDLFRFNKAIYKTPCGNFKATFRENLDIVRNYRFNVSKELLRNLDLDDAGIRKLSEKRVTKSNEPVFLHAASANHFGESQALFKNIHQKVMPKYKNIKLVFYDIGLKPEQLSLFRKHCRCDIRTFPFDEFPLHVRNIGAYTWKPILIQLLLQEFDFVMWMDSSVRFNGILDSLFFDALQSGFKTMPGGGDIAVRTHSNTFKVLGEKTCMFVWPGCQGGWVLVKRNKFTLSTIMKPWVSCALQFGCMAQPPPLYPCDRGRNKPKKEFNSCHRFDQSVLGIILTRLFNYKLQLTLFKVHDYGVISRNDKSDYFEVLDSMQ